MDDSADFNQCVIPMHTFVDWPELPFDFPFDDFQSERNAGPIAAIKLWVSICTELEKKIGVRQLRCSLIKATRSFGNTSVSMGIAKEYFTNLSALGRDLEEDSKTGLAVLNFGTGGAKMYGYTKDESGQIKCLFDDIKQTGDAPSPNGCLHIFGDDYVVEFCHKMVKNAGAEEFTTREEEFKREHERIANYIKLGLQKFEENGIPASKVQLKGFITGTLREYYENCEDLQEVLDHAARDYFAYQTEHNAGIPLEPYAPKTFFMTQERESFYEKEAVSCMHQNLLAAGKLTKENANIISAVGVGQGSFQWGSLLIPFGMKTPDTMTTNVLDVIKTYPAALDKNLDASQFERTHVIGLKSGFLLFYDKCPAFQKWLHDRARASTLQTKMVDEKEESVNIHVGISDALKTSMVEAIDLLNEAQKELEQSKVEEKKEESVNINVGPHPVETRILQVIELLQEAQKELCSSSAVGIAKCIKIKSIKIKSSLLRGHQVLNNIIEDLNLWQKAES